MKNCAYFDTTWNGNHSSFLTLTVVGGRCPLASEICAQSDPPPSKNADFDRFPLITWHKAKRKASSMTRSWWVTYRVLCVCVYSCKAGTPLGMRAACIRPYADCMHIVGPRLYRTTLSALSLYRSIRLQCFCLFILRKLVANQRCC